MEQPLAPSHARAPVRILIGAAVLVVVLVAALLAWRLFWSEREFAADEVPTSCVDFSAVKDAEFPGSPPGKDEFHSDRLLIPRPSSDGGSGSTLMCGWAHPEMVVTILVERWADGADAAAAGYAAARDGWPDLPPAGIGDESVLHQLGGSGSGWFGLARTGNVIVHINPVVMPPDPLPEDTVARILEGLVAAIES